MKDFSKPHPALERSRLIANRLAQCVDNNEVFAGDFIHIFENLCKDALTISDYAKKQGVSYNTIKNNIDNLPTISIGGQTFVL